MKHIGASPFMVYERSGLILPSYYVRPAIIKLTIFGALEPAFSLLV
jgi:hypothetical protein